LFYNIIIYYHFTSHWISSIKSHWFLFTCWNIGSTNIITSQLLALTL